MTSSDGKALYSAILKTPDDNGLRSVYADWLEENGQPERAELIRIGVALSTGQDIAGRPLKKRTRAELVKSHLRTYPTCRLIKTKLE